MAAVELGTVFRIFLVSCASIGKVFIVAGGGFYLTKRGIITQASKKALSGISSKLCLPCLLFGRIIKSVNWSVLADAWPIVPFALFYVSMGIGLATLLQACVGTPSDQRSAMKACMGFANSQALPILMVEVIGPALFDAEAADLGVTYIALYLVLYLILQWTVGAWLMGVPLSSDEKNKTNEPTSYATVGPSSPTSSKEDELEAAETASTLECAVVELPLRPSPLDSATEAPCEEVPAASNWKATAAGLWNRIAVPPVMGIWAGLAVGLSPDWIHSLFVGDNAPLSFAVQGMDMLGGAAIPVSMMLLGSSLEKGPDWSSIHRPTVAGTVLGKLLLMPIIALTVVFSLSGIMHVPQMCLLVVLIESATPSANNLVVMCELAGGKQTRTVATTLFVEYCAVPVLLTLTMTTFMVYVESRTT